MKQLFLILITISSLAISSCKKDKGEDPAIATTKQKIQGKWQINSISIKRNFVGEENTVTQRGTPSDYMDFMSDGKLHTYFKGKLTVNDYRVVNENTISIDQDDASIRALNDSTMRLLTKDATGTIGFTQVIYDLKK
jgi:hypothetical protein